MFQLESEDKKIRWPSSKNIKQKNSWYPSLKTIRKEVSSLIKEGQPFCFIQTFNWLMRPTQIRESNLICYWSTAKSCPNLCNPTDSSTPGFPILHIAQSFLKLMSTESVMPSNHLILPLPSPPALSLSQHQGLFQWVSSLHQVAKVLELQLQHLSFQWIFRVDFL